MKTKNQKKSWKVIHEESSTWARWIALYEAVNFIADKADQKNIPLKTKLKPIAISKYIEDTQDMYLRKLLEQEYKINFYFDDSLEKIKN
jgi:hypothetical protein